MGRYTCLKCMFEAKLGEMNQHCAVKHGIGKTCLKCSAISCSPNEQQEHWTLSGHPKDKSSGMFPRLGVDYSLNLSGNGESKSANKTNDEKTIKNDEEEDMHPLVLHISDGESSPRLEVKTAEKPIPATDTASDTLSNFSTLNTGGTGVSNILPTGSTTTSNEILVLLSGNGESKAANKMNVTKTIKNDEDEDMPPLVLYISESDDESPTRREVKHPAKPSPATDEASDSISNFNTLNTGSTGVSNILPTGSTTSANAILELQHQKEHPPPSHSDLHSGSAIKVTTPEKPQSDVKQLNAAGVKRFICKRCPFVGISKEIGIHCTEDHGIGWKCSYSDLSGACQYIARNIFRKAHHVRETGHPESGFVGAFAKMKKDFDLFIPKAEGAEEKMEQTNPLNLQPTDKESFSSTAKKVPEMSKPDTIEAHTPTKKTKAATHFQKYESTVTNQPNENPVSTPHPPIPTSNVIILHGAQQKMWKKKKKQYTCKRCKHLAGNSRTILCNHKPDLDQTKSIHSREILIKQNPLNSISPGEGTQTYPEDDSICHDVKPIATHTDMTGDNIYGCSRCHFEGRFQETKSHCAKVHPTWEELSIMLHCDDTGHPKQFSGEYPMIADGDLSLICEYDENGNIIEYGTLYDIDGIELEYDDEGVLLSKKPHDAEGTPIEGFDEAGNPVYYEQGYDEDGNPIDYEYDENGNIILYDVDGIELEYDEEGMLLSKQPCDAEGIPIEGFDEEGQPVYYEKEYDEDGNIDKGNDEDNGDDDDAAIMGTKSGEIEPDTSAVVKNPYRCARCSFEAIYESAIKKHCAKVHEIGKKCSRCAFHAEDNFSRKLHQGSTGHPNQFSGRFPTLPNDFYVLVNRAIVKNTCMCTRCAFEGRYQATKRHIAEVHKIGKKCSRCHFHAWDAISRKLHCDSTGHQNRFSGIFPMIANGDINLLDDGEDDGDDAGSEDNGDHVIMETKFVEIGPVSGNRETISKGNLHLSDQETSDLVGNNPEKVNLGVADTSADMVGNSNSKKILSTSMPGFGARIAKASSTNSTIITNNASSTNGTSTTNSMSTTNKMGSSSGVTSREAIDDNYDYLAEDFNTQIGRIINIIDDAEESDPPLLSENQADQLQRLVRQGNEHLYRYYCATNRIADHDKRFRRFIKNARRMVK